ncbi:MAG: hypothetical protein KJI71_00900 [Patescibacteria group bacterium]|nr:hypothetical protein [Patescibacteria group bacterium]
MNKKTKAPSVGISQIGVSIPRHFISVEELAKKRKLPPGYAIKGLGVFQARTPYQSSIEDLAVEALRKIDYQDVQRFYIGTESDSDISKPFGVKIINRRLKLTAIPFQYKFACLGGLEALISACEYSVAHQGKPAIALAVDRSIYQETEPAAEVTQGSAAVAMRVEMNPKLLILDYQGMGQYATDIDDFRVPVSSFPFPVVNGGLTKPAYLECQKKALEDWKRNNSEIIEKLNKRGKTFLEMFNFFIMHAPFPKIVEWASAMFWRHEKPKQKEHLSLAECIKDNNLFKEYKKELDKIRKLPEFQKFFIQKVKPTLKYNSYIGNSYTCSIFISLIAVLEKAKEGQEIAISGYGGGAGSICLKGTVARNINFKSDLSVQVKKGKKLSFAQYEQWRKKEI